MLHIIWIVDCGLQSPTHILIYFYTKLEENRTLDCKIILLLQRNQDFESMYLLLSNTLQSVDVFVKIALLINSEENRTISVLSYEKTVQMYLLHTYIFTFSIIYCVQIIIICAVQIIIMRLSNVNIMQVYKSQIRMSMLS